jgi:hypothetical protein
MTLSGMESNTEVVFHIEWRVLSLPNRPIADSFLCWAKRAPAEITVAFHAAGTIRPWTFARGLLLEGLCEGVAGQGDVRITSGLGNLVLSLSSPYGTARLQTGTALVKHFLDCTYSIVSREEETIDIDAVLVQIFEKEGM